MCASYAWFAAADSLLNGSRRNSMPALAMLEGAAITALSLAGQALPMTRKRPLLVLALQL
jgi:hypothetical protein